MGCRARLPSLVLTHPNRFWALGGGGLRVAPTFLRPTLASDASLRMALKKRRRGREDNPAPAQVAGARYLPARLACWDIIAPYVRCSLACLFQKLAAWNQCN